MAGNYNKTWVSHTRISDFLKCTRAYWLRNVYKNPKTGRRMTVMTPPLALGQAVHEVIESLATLPTEERFLISPVKKLDSAWLKVTGKKGGFKNYSIESEFRDRAIVMLKRLEGNPGILLKKAIKIKSKDNFDLPHFDLSPKDEIILSGKIDWLNYDEDDTVKIYDFKTGKNEESDDSLQLPIYLLLATNTQSKKVSGAYYWYLDRENGIVEKELPDAEESRRRVLELALKIKELNVIGVEKCSKGSCMHCRSLERVFNGEGEFVGVSDMNQDVYFLND
jgi:ATP-dependent helicase/DNAse subunit B